MENASKALIIAGAILLSILLISLGIMVYQNAKNATDGTGLDAEKAQAFNTKISQYCGNKKSASDMNALVDAIAASNGNESKVTDKHPISLVVSGIDAAYYNGSNNISGNTATTAGQSTKYPRFSTGMTYKAEYETGSDGYINKVTISKN